MLRRNACQGRASLGSQGQPICGIKVAQAGEGPLLQRWGIALEPHGEECSQEYYVRVLGKETVCKYL